MTEPAEPDPTTSRSRRGCVTVRWRRAAVATSLSAGVAVVGPIGGHTLAEVAGHPSSGQRSGHDREVREGGAAPVQLPVPPGPGR